MLPMISSLQSWDGELERVGSLFSQLPDGSPKGAFRISLLNVRLRHGWIRHRASVAVH